MQKDKLPQPQHPELPNGPGLRYMRVRLGWFATLLLIAIVTLLLWHLWHRTPSKTNSTLAAGTPAAHASGGLKGTRRSPQDNKASTSMRQPVKVAAVSNGDMPITLNALGTVTPLAAVTVRTQLNGTLTAIYFQEGQFVKKGDVLAQIDPRPYEISLRNAEGQLAKNQALLRQALCDLNTYRTLLKQNAISRQQTETQASLVDQYRGQVKSDQANIDTYKLDLRYARITAPVSGRIGLRQIDPGNYITTADLNGIATITQMQPISVIFSTSEDNLQPILKQLSTGAKLSAIAYDRSNSRALAHGELQTIDNQIDTATGTIKLRAVFPNADQALFPNQFVNVRLLVNTLKNVAIVPSSAVLNGSIGTFVYVVNADNTVSVRAVKTGPLDGERTSIVSDLAMGERVVIDGSDRLREDMPITIPTAAPKAPDAFRARGSHHLQPS